MALLKHENTIKPHIVWYISSMNLL